MRRLVVETPLNAKLNLGALTSLEELACHGNTDFAALAGSRSLRALSVHSMSCALPDLPMLSRLEITEANCIDLHFTPRIPAVEILILTKCQKLKSLEGIEYLSHLTHVSVESCHDLSDISSLSEMTSIRYLEVRNCPKVLSFECLPVGIKDVFLFQTSKHGLDSAKAAIERTRPQNYTLT